MNQHESRKVAMQAVFLANQEPDLTAAAVEAKIIATLDLKKLSAYSKKLIAGVLADRPSLQKKLETHLKKGWRLKRVNPTVVAIMEIALFEIEKSDAIDPKAAINEALNLCDEFADPQEKSFINGVLANFVK